MFEGLEEIAAGPRVIEHGNGAVVMGDFGDGWHIQNFKRAGAGAFHIDHCGVRDA